MPRCAMGVAAARGYAGGEDGLGVEGGGARAALGDGDEREVTALRRPGRRFGFVARDVAPSAQ